MGRITANHVMWPSNRQTSGAPGAGQDWSGNAIHDVGAAGQFCSIHATNTVHSVTQPILTNWSEWSRYETGGEERTLYNRSCYERRDVAQGCI